MLAKIGRFLYHRRRVTLGVFLILVVGTAIYGLDVFRFLNTGDVGVENSESSQAVQLLQTKFPHSGTDVLLLLSSKTFKATDQAFKTTAIDLLSKLQARPEVASLTSYYSTQSPDLLSRDGRETFVLIQLKGQPQDFFTKQSEYNSLKPALSSQTLEVLVGGPIPTAIVFDQQANNDLQRAESFTLPVLVVLMLLVFDGVIAALLPLLIGGVAILGAFAVLRGLTTLTDVAPYAINVVTMLGLGVTIDYALFTITRFREELNSNGQDVCAALERTMATAGRTVIFSALTVSTSLLTLLLFPVPYLRSLGLGAISTILVVMLISLTLLPVLLALLGRRVNALALSRIFKSRRAPGKEPRARTGVQQGMWYRLAETVMRWPVPVTLVVLIILLVLGIPFLHIKFATVGVNVLPANQEVRVVNERLSQDFVHRGNAQISIIVQTPGNALEPDSLASLDRYVKSIQALPGVVAVQSLVTVRPDLNLTTYQQLYAHPGLNPQITQAAASLANGNFSQMTVALQPADHSSAAATLVKQIRALDPSGGLKAFVDGITPEEIDLLAGIEGTLPVAFLVIIASIFMLLFLMTGSLIVPLKAIILNMLSLSATFGGLVWIFQDGHLQNLLHFELLGSIDAAQPVLIFAIAFGLSMDYEVFVLSRIKESFDETGNNRLAVSLGIQSTGWLITSAALLLAVVLVGFGAAVTISIQEIGIGLALAVVMDATLIRTLLLPATMRLLGTFNWWAPASLRWLWQYIGLKEEPSVCALSPTLEKVASAPALSPTLKIQTGWDRSGEHLPASLEVVMEPEILLWRSPNDALVDGSLFQVASDQFCVLKASGTILKVYETGRYSLQPPDVCLLDLIQLGFDGQPLSWEYEALYINRAKLAVRASGVALPREMVEVAYSVDYAFHVATHEDAVRLVKQMSSRIQSLSTRDLNAYAGRVIEYAVNQLVQVTPFSQMQNLRQALSQVVQRSLMEFLAKYGITLDEVNVQVNPRREHVKPRFQSGTFDPRRSSATSARWGY